MNLFILTSFRLTTILEENSHTIMIIEHDPLLYEDAHEMICVVASHGL